MSGRVQKRLRAFLPLLLLAGARAQGQYYRQVVEEPRLLTLRVDQAATGVYAEGYEQTTHSAGSSSTQTRSFFGPLIGLGLSGSIYHPNLFAYRLNADGSFGWSQDEFKGVTTQTATQFRYLGSFVGTAKLLDNKPLNGSLYGGYTQTYQDYDFFNRIYIDHWRYGGALRYTVGPWNFSGSVYRDTQDSTGYGIPLKGESTTASLEATENRKSGSTSLAATWTDFNNNDFGFEERGIDYTLAASDAEDFGSRKQFHSLVSLGLNHLEELSVPTDLYNALGNLRVEHTERLTSQYAVNYSRNSFGSARTDNLNGSANVQHRLYESLTSHLNLQGYRYSAESGSDRQDSWQFGGGPGVNYVKKLSASSTLSAYESVTLLYTDVESAGGVIPVIDEQYVFGSGGGGPDNIQLRQPNVIGSTIQVRDGTLVYILGQDYEVIPNGQFTIIQRRTGVSRIPAGGAVMVSYSFNATPSGAYDTLINAFGLRLEFFDHHWGVFTRLNTTRNYGSANLLVQNLNDWVVGTDGTWRFLRAGAEYEIYDSNLSPFKALRFFQTLTFHPEEDSALSLNFTETFLSYEQAARQEQNYAAILRYNQSFTRHLALNLELGANQRVGPGLDETLAVFRSQLHYAAGKFSATIGYDFGYDEYLSTEKRIRNMGFIRVRKEF